MDASIEGNAPRIVLINGSLHGDSENSNTLMLLKLAEQELLKRGAQVTIISPDLVKFGANGEQSMYVLNADKVLEELKSADGFIVGTGTHWGQSSSVLQKFIEDATPSEGTEAWLGKPSGIIVSSHSTGGDSVAKSLMATLSNYGAFVVPQGYMDFSRSGQAAKATKTDWAEDVWGPDDVGSICENVVKYAAALKGVKLESWPVDDDPTSFHQRWVSRYPGVKSPETKADLG